MGVTDNFSVDIVHEYNIETLDYLSSRTAILPYPYNTYQVLRLQDNAKYDEYQKRPRVRGRDHAIASFGLARWVVAVLVRFSRFYPFSLVFSFFSLLLLYVGLDITTCILFSVISLSLQLNSI